MTSKTTDLTKMDIGASMADSPYTTSEIKKAQSEAESIRRELAMLGRMTFSVAEKLYNFSSKGMYRVIGFETLNDWLESIRYAPSTYQKYISIYKELTQRLGIPKEKYETIDMGKVVSLQRLAEKVKKADLSLEDQVREIENHIEAAKELAINDLIVSTNEKIRALGGDIDSDEDVPVKSPLDYLKPTVYKIVPLTKEDRDIDPRIKASDMILVKGARVKLWFSDKEESFVLEVD